MRTLAVELGPRRYPVHVGRELPPALLAEVLAGRPAAAVVDARLARRQGPRLDAWLGGLPRLTVPSGEGSKRLVRVERLAGRLLELGLGRDGVLVAAGGGVVGDLAGFLAASYLRGVPFVQLPTTLLAQVDASLGGKTAVHLAGARNALGFFHQPLAVMADLAWLDTLSRRDLRAGLAELVKTMAVADPAWLERLAAAGPALLDPHAPLLEAAVTASCRHKAAVVAADEREDGRRRVLNFGHTLAHALEAAGPRPAWRHGEAVALGMLAALRLGEREGITPPALRRCLTGLFGSLGLPGRLPPDLAAARLLALMDRDKKRRGGRVEFVLLEAWGRPRAGIVVAPSRVAAVLREFGAA
ncbi:MAG: 3-dehydroquinate synthase [Candidatus Krumholzibacteriota bacterium]|nr:3-dehydroquinate synthase [Candidatus Krumholzibacteriota bacterium]